MNTDIRLGIIVFVVFLIIISTEYLAYASFHTAGIIKSEGLEIMLMVIGIVIPLIFLISMMYGYKHYSTLNAFINTISSLWLSFVFFVFLSSLIVFLMIMLNHYFNIGIPIKIISNILILSSIVLTFYGVWNSSHIEKMTYDIKASNLGSEWHGKKIILLSDLHIGNLRGENFIKRIVTMTNAENPDFVFIAGDLIEGSSFPYKEWLRDLEGIDGDTKIFYVEGNHEGYNLEYNLFKEGIPQNIENITDKKLILGETQLIGLHHEETENPQATLSRLKSLDYDKNKPSIVLIHNPKNAIALSQENVSLILSGHTHNGQFLPFTWLIKFLYKDLAYSITKKENSTTIVSSGVGTSMIPLRLGTKSEIVIINMD